MLIFHIHETVHGTSSDRQYVCHAKYDRIAHQLTKLTTCFPWIYLCCGDPDAVHMGIVPVGTSGLEYVLSTPLRVVRGD